jgi:hypothetical protein
MEEGGKKVPTDSLREFVASQISPVQDVKFIFQP